MNERFLGTRRNLFDRAARMVAPIAAIPLAGGLPDLKPKEPTLDEIVARVRRFEAAEGNRVLTNDEAKEYVPLIANLFVKTSQSPRKPSELADHTYTVRGEPRVFDNVIRLTIGDIDDPESTQAVKRFREDHPTVEMTKDLAQVIAHMSSGYRAGAWYWNNKTFFILGDTDPSEIAGIWSMQYKGKGHVVECGYPAPVTVSRSRLLHEYTHADGYRGWFELEPEILDVYLEGAKKFWEKEGHPMGEVKGYKNNFMVYYSVKDPDDPVERVVARTGLNEFVTDYLASRVSITHGLPYTIGYGNPDFFADFETVLQQSKISTEQLWLMYRNSQLEEFLLKIANGAYNANFESDADRLRWVYDRFDLFSPTPFFGVKSLWESSYPDIIGSHYVYIDSSVYNLDVNRWPLGCLPKNNP